jgi:hypothetical protein
MRLLFDFAYHLETLPKGGLDGEIILLRDFLRKKGIYKDEQK